MAGGGGNASSVLSAILGGGGGGGAAGNGNPSDNAGLTLDRSLPNAFALDVILYAGNVGNAQGANMRIGLTQGTSRRSGYWITVIPGATPSVSLHVISRRAESCHDHDVCVPHVMMMCVCASYVMMMCVCLMS